ncbi:hypothetical protein EVAR_83786_1 [Eumeta japonica]|uniref:Uncharacterized protein n=1 Tax=Eumeta variegata TaxID=151549 RepID=A0A4C1WI81_EUMVA|nr:hypothetical protein EVAR_83786_1 [Eumeta japonica]
MKKLCSRWISHNLTEAQKMDRVTWCDAMLTGITKGASNLVWDIVIEQSCFSGALSNCVAHSGVTYALVNIIILLHREEERWNRDQEQERFRDPNRYEIEDEERHRDHDGNVIARN